MTRSIFVFITSLFLLVPLVSVAGTITIQSQLLYCTPFILLLGIPHGAIDNFLYQKRHSPSNAVFITVYLLVFGLNIMLWMVYPPVAYVLFLVLSAYHFGQSQFSHHFLIHKGVQAALFLSWGLTVLSGLILFNLQEVQALINSYIDFQNLRAVHDPILIQSVFLISLATSFSLLLVLLKIGKMKAQDLFMELLVLGLILVSFYLLPLLIGFTLYFIVLHALKVLKEEYHVLFQSGNVRSFMHFVKLVFPFTALSLVGMALLSGVIYLEWLPISYGYGLLIVISSITLPHAFVMNRFYADLFDAQAIKRFL